MSRTVTIQLKKPIVSAYVVDDATVSPERKAAEAKDLELKVQKESLTQLSQALQDALNKLNGFQQDVLKEHKAQIAKLSVEIARKILMQKVQEGDYKIEPIIEKALENTPTRQDVVVRLNPDDLAQWEKSGEKDAQSICAGIKFAADPDIGRAECLIETPRGAVESFIDQNLERIGEALKNTE
ncbi:MAG: FliH/SctL family protein [Planctomycetota bacterium]|jgi:flagellar biosynthesis/type III secretory pathway protein FliH